MIPGSACLPVLWVLGRGVISAGEAPPLLASLAGSLGDALAISRLSRTRLRRRPAALLGSAAPDGLQQRDLAHQVDDVIVEEAAAGAGEVGHR